MGKLKIFEAFAGIGCQRIALRNLGLDYESVGISEVDRYAIIGYDAIHNQQIEAETVSKNEMINEIKKRNIAYNFSTNKSEIPKKDSDLKRLYDAHMRSKNYGDIRTINLNELPDFDLFTYSPPCKNISVEGKQDSLSKDSGTQSSLIWECLRIIKGKRPKYLLFENVKNILAYNHKPHFDEFCNKLEEFGYVNHYSILNGLNFGVPQNRERCMMFSVLKEYDKGIELPTGERSEVTIFDILDECTEGYDLSERDMNTFLELTKLKEDNEDVLIVPNGTTKGYLELDIPGVFDFNYPRSKSRRGRVKEGGLICGTIPATESNVLFVSKQDGIVKPRKLTTKEVWRLQGHSDNDLLKAKLIGELPERKLRERAGRSIVIPMLEEIFKVYLEEYINEGYN